MKYYAGLDVSLKETFICIVDEQGEPIFETSACTQPEAISEAINQSRVEVALAAIETGSLSHWLVSNLQVLGVPTICVDARHLASVLSMKINKTDQNDARGIANALRCGYYREVPLKSQEQVETQTLLQSRAILVAERTKMKNAIRGLLKSYGIKITGTGKLDFTEKVFEAISNEIDSVRFSIEVLLSTYETFHAQIDKLDKEVRKRAAKNEDACLLMTIPGIGPITALSYLVALGIPSRFIDSRDVGAYMGLTPRQYSSGEVQRLGRISKCGCRQVRSLLVEGAIVMMTRTKAWNKQKAWALKLQRKKGFKKAAVALARKLSVMMHSMLLSRKPFDYAGKTKKSQQVA